MNLTKMENSSTFRDASEDFAYVVLLRVMASIKTGVTLVEYEPLHSSIKCKSDDPDFSIDQVNVIGRSPINYDITAYYKDHLGMHHVKCTVSFSLDGTVVIKGERRMNFSSDVDGVFSYDLQSRDTVQIADFILDVIFRKQLH